MNRTLAAAALAALLCPPLPVAATTPPDPAALRDRALDDPTAYAIVEGLTTEIGPRLTGSEAEARARAWGVERLRALGFSNVRIETYQVEGWERGAEQAEILSPAPQRLHVTALGHSGATPAGGIEADLVGFATFADFEAAPASAVAGRIVFVDHRMTATQDGSSYGAFGAVRRKAPALAARKGAAAILIRSLGTDHHRLPHTGITSRAAGEPAFPAGALSVPDAEQLSRLLARGAPVRMRLVLTPRFVGPRVSGNVIAEIPGRDPAAGLVVVGGHIDSWDLGTGALDDAAGVAITSAAARLVGSAGRPLRTIRVVWWGSEETGAAGAADYHRRHGAERHVAAAESDFGADRVWQFVTRVEDPGAAVLDRLAQLLAPLGITRGGNDAYGGADVRELAEDGVPIVGLKQDGTRYFDIHHTADDTLDRIDPLQLRQNVAAWTAFLAVAANSPDWPSAPGNPRVSEAK